MKTRKKPSDDVSEWYRVTVEGGRVMELSWDHLDLTGTIPAFIGSLSALTRLSLNTNKPTGSIPRELGALKNLTYLDLYQVHTRLSSTIPSTLALLQNLEHLQLVHKNSLCGEIPPEIGLLDGLVELDL